MQVLKFAGKFYKFCSTFKRKKIKCCFLPFVRSAFKRKKLTLTNEYKIKTLANGYKPTEKKVASTVIYICLLLQRNVEMTITVFNSYISCLFS
jgi:hypothetical protein